MEPTVLDMKPLTLDLEPLPESVTIARHEVERWLRDVGAEHVVGVVALLVTELASNAVLHGGAPYTVAAQWTPPLLRVDVTDSSPPPGTDLQLVDRLSDSWGVVTRGERESVWFVVEDTPGA